MTKMRIKSSVSSPSDGAAVRAGESTTIRGGAWSGFAPVARVEISVDAGASWRDATVAPAKSPGAYQAWELSWIPKAPGLVTILARAHDAAGNVQPLSPTWKLLGYGWNSVVPVHLKIE